MGRTPRALIKAEEENRIPQASREMRGSISARKWQLKDLPAIGEKYGFLKKPKKQQIISVFVAKGGVLKTTISYNFARILALHNIKTIIIGTDVQESITTLVLGKDEITNINQIKTKNGLHELIIKGESIANVIVNTEIPTFDIIPENSNLTLLDQEVTKSPRMVDVFKEELISKLADYEVIIFDSSPNFNNLTKNALTASKHIISPISCEIGTFQAIEQNLEILNKFKTQARLNWETYLMIPTLLDNNNLSKQILGSYISQFPENISSSTIKRAVKGQEAQAINQSIFEYMPKSDLADEYYALAKEIWNRINVTEVKQ